MFESVCVFLMCIVQVIFLFYCYRHSKRITREICFGDIAVCILGVILSFFHMIFPGEVMQLILLLFLLPYTIAGLVTLMDICSKGGEE